MWRSAVLALSTHNSVQKIATQTRLGQRVASRFVAGETPDDAMRVASELSANGALIEIDYLGEHVTQESQAAQAVAVYSDILERIARTQVPAHISLKPSQMGIELNEALCYRNFASVVALAKQLNNFVWIDMEGSQFTDRTLEVYTRLHSAYGNVGIALQSYLRRCKMDVERVISLGGTIRLVKGAYAESPQVAFPRKSDVDRNFQQLSEALLASGLYQAIATHDERMIEHAIHFANSHGIDKSSFEFQMLYGIRRDLQARLLKQGYRLRVYVPFGDQWYPYLMRRLAERPANLLFFISSLIAELRQAQNGT